MRVPLLQCDGWILCVTPKVTMNAWDTHSRLNLGNGVKVSLPHAPWASASKMEEASPALMAFSEILKEALGPHIQVLTGEIKYYGGIT